MKQFLIVPFVCLLVTPALAQTATGVGVGTGTSSSSSQSQAIGGGAATGGSASGGTSNLILNSPTNPASTTSNINQNLTGTSTVRNVPPAYAPGLAAAGLETCLGSISGGGSVVGFGASFGTTIPDPGCAARLDARTLWSFGLKKAALARLCLTPEVYRSMPEVCVQYLPQQAGYSVVAAAAPEYTGGPVEVIEKKTGLPRICNDYDVTRQRCRVWAHGR